MEEDDEYLLPRISWVAYFYEELCPDVVIGAAVVKPRSIEIAEDIFSPHSEEETLEDILHPGCELDAIDDVPHTIGAVTEDETSSRGWKHV